MNRSKQLRFALYALLASSAAPAIADHPQGAQAMATSQSQKEAANIALVTQFYNAALNEKDAEKAASYLGDVYIQHNPLAKDGAEGLKGFVAWLKSTFPDNRSEIKRAFADGDHVILHVHTKRTPEQRGNAIMEIFRLDNGKIVEHWDVIQEIPEKSANENGMF